MAGQRCSILRDLRPPWRTCCCASTFSPAILKAPPSMMKADFGLLSPGAIRGACGVGVLVDLNANKTHRLVKDGLRILCNLDHRGARGAEEKTGDGAGMWLPKPHEFFRSGIPSLDALFL